MFLDPNEFEFTSMLEAKWEIIRDEFVELRTVSFDPWVQREMYGEGWSVYRLYLGLVVPSGCRLRGNDDTRHWHEGNALVFDDTVEHDAWNDSDQVRGNLSLDFPRPGETGFEADILPKEVYRYAESLSRQSRSIPTRGITNGCTPTSDSRRELDAGSKLEHQRNFSRSLSVRGG